MANSGSKSDSDPETECPRPMPTRGATQMNKISRLMDQGKRVALKVNDKGQYCRKSFSKLMGFIVSDSFKHDCLILAWKLMKDFKNRMTKDVIMPAIEEMDVERLAQLPEKHPEIYLIDWLKFVQVR
ncbi:hypothetical protein CsatA_018361 [Cannabis sativa]